MFTSVHMFTSIQVHENTYTCLQVYMFTNTLVYIIQCLQVHDNMYT